MKKIVALFIVLFIVFIMYSINYDRRIYYLSLGDSLALGKNSYGINEYSYSDYLANYLRENNLLEKYINNYVKQDIKIPDIINDIQTNKKIFINNKEYGLKQILTNSDIITLSIGNTDLFNTIEKNLSNLDIDLINKSILELMKELEKLIIEIKKYCKKEIIIIGYYNPVSNNLSEKKEIDCVFDNIYKKYYSLEKKYDVNIINTNKMLSSNSNFLPNPFSYYPSKNGYIEISKEIINIIERKITNINNV